MLIPIGRPSVEIGGLGILFRLMRLSSPRESREIVHDRIILIAFGTVVFLLGASVYPLRSAGLLTEGIVFANFAAFAHTLFFTLAWAYPFKSRSSAILGAISVALVATGFELTQLESVRENLDGFLPPSVLAYGAQGVFDTRDIWAGIAGSAMAVGLTWLVILKQTGKKEKPCSNS